MQTSSNIAFKEWAVVCAALAAGRQTIILRKGGIDEGREGFRVAHYEFWLLPTRFHQDPSQLTPDAKPLWQQVHAQPPPPGKFQIDLYAVVQKVFEVRRSGRAGSNRRRAHSFRRNHPTAIPLSPSRLVRPGRANLQNPAAARSERQPLHRRLQKLGGIASVDFHLRRNPGARRCRVRRTDRSTCTSATLMFIADPHLM